MRPTTAIAAALALLAVGCTEMVQQPADVTETPAAADPAPDVDTGPSAAPSSGASAAPGATAVPTLLRTDPLAEAVHPLGDLGGTLEVDLRVEPVGDLLRVALTFTPRGIDDQGWSLATLLGAEGTHEAISARLLDPVNLLEYSAIRPAVPQATMAPAHVDHPTTLMFYFGAPAERLATFDLLLDLSATTPDWPGFVDVPFPSA